MIDIRSVPNLSIHRLRRRSINLAMVLYQVITKSLPDNVFSLSPSIDILYKYAVIADITAM